MKNKFGEVSKLIIEKFNKNWYQNFVSISGRTPIQFWKDLDMPNKKDSSLIQLDIKEFYPSSNEDILTNAIQFAKLQKSIDEKNLRLIMNW